LAKQVSVTFLKKIGTTGTKRKMTQESAVCVYDFTLSVEESGLSNTEVKDLLMNHCKKWCFQMESGTKTGYVHYQGRISLKVKDRMPGVLRMFGDGSTGWRWSVTSTANRDNMFYVIKSDTKIEGPWADNDPPPKFKSKKLERMEELGPMPWQQSLMDIAEVEDWRAINFIHDEVGGMGKSTFADWLEYNKDGFMVPPFDKMDDILAWVMTAGANNPKTHFFIDLPRAMEQLKMRPLYSAIEVLKEGRAYDKRYHGRMIRFDYPIIYVFGNTIPDTSMLSEDRWKFWKIDDQKLVSFIPQKKVIVPKDKGKRKIVEVDE